jgi:dTDP-L-rhamnose 4-epimerase
MQRNIFITGGAGFIGSRLVLALLKEIPNCKIWVLDNLHSQVHGVGAKQPDFPASVVFIKGDVSDKGLVKSVVSEAQPEIVYHLAAETGTGQSYDELSRYCDVNVMGTVNVIESVRSESSGATKKIILAASRAVYGEGAYEDENGRVFTGLPREAETMSTGNFEVPLPVSAQLPAKACKSDAELSSAPASVYASTKLMQEYLLKQAGEGSKWKATILRFQNVYGPGQSLRNPYTGVLSIFARQLLEDKDLDIYEDGLIARDFVFVDDVVNSLVKAGVSELPHGTTLDIGSGEAISILEVAKILMKNLGRSDDSYKVTGKYRVGDIRYACADISAANDKLGWKPEVNVQEGLALLAKWAEEEFKDNNL